MITTRYLPTYFETKIQNKIKPCVNSHDKTTFENANANLNIIILDTTNFTAKYYINVILYFKHCIIGLITYYNIFCINVQNS